MLGLLFLLAVLRLDPQQERELVERAKTSSFAFGELYDHYFPIIYGYVLKRVGNQEDAEDIASLTFERALKNIDRFEWKGVSFSAWLYRIATNIITDYFRSKGSHRQVSFQEVEGMIPAMEMDAAKIEMIARLMEIIGRLPTSYQHMLTLKFYEGLTLDEMSETLGLSKKTVTMKLYRSMKALRKLVMESGLELS